jgi:hypothetical protein
MKELLYIPSGKYVRFPEGGGSTLEEFLNWYSILRGKNKLNYLYPEFETAESTIAAICKFKQDYNESAHKSAEIDRNKPLFEWEFEVVEV